MLSKDKIKTLLGGAEIDVYNSIDSTNSEAKRCAQNGEVLPRLICAESQRAGRGRLGRSFYSPEGTGLYMSLAFEAAADMSDAVTITSAAAVAVADTVDELCNTESKIKWVNDIYVNDRKVCGILTEATRCDKKNVIVVGIGINCTTAFFPDDIKDKAGSVGKVDRNILAAKIAEKLLAYANDPHDRSWLAHYKKRSLVLGKEISYTENNITKKAEAIDIDQKGGLVISENGELKTLSTGEISVKF